MTSTASTTHGNLSSTLPLRPGRRVHVNLGEASTATGVIVGGRRVDVLDDYDYDVRVDGTPRIHAVAARYLIPVTPTPKPLIDDHAAILGATKWIAQSRGQLDALDGSYNSGVYQMLMEAGRDLCRAIDAERSTARPCIFTWTWTTEEDGAEATALYGCAFDAEPNARFCGAHLPYADRCADYSHKGAIIVAPLGVHDAFAMFG